METTRAQRAVGKVKCDKWGRACCFEVSTVMLSGLRRLKASLCAAESHATAAQRVKFRLNTRNCGEGEGGDCLSCCWMQKW